MLTILTPSYNRGYIIENAYKSLLRQKDKDFEWLVIDDGSTDDTEKIVNSFIKQGKINIRYYKKTNGGKHTAVNYGVGKAKGNYILILDSDDYLTDDAVKKIGHYWKKYDNNENICCLSFLREYPDKKVIGKTYEGSEIISDNINFRYNKGVLGDMAEVFKTNILKKYPFPVFSNERFLSEAIVWNEIALEYKTVYINEAIYICEYLEDGLSNSCLKARIRCPKGSIENARIFLNEKFKLSIRLKNAIIYTGFSLIDKRNIKEIIGYSGHKMLIISLFPLGILFYLFLKLKQSK